MKKSIFSLIILAMAISLLPTQLPTASAQGVNLIANPSVETVNPTQVNFPQGWTKEKRAGSSNVRLNYLTNGQDGTRSINVTESYYANGAAKWVFDPVTIKPSTQYEFSNYYIASVSTTLEARLTSSTGQISTLALGSPTASSIWKQNKVTFTTPANASKVTVYQSLNQVGSLQTDNYSLNETTPPPVDTQAPTASLTTPAAGATVSGSVSWTATSSDNIGVTKVDLLVDGLVQSTDATSPYGSTWNSVSASNGIHTLAAKAYDAAGNTGMSADVQVNVNNPATPPPPPSLIPNPSVETVSATNANLPDQWLKDSWGTNTPVFSYLTTGHSGSRSVKTQITSYTDGDAKWYYTPQSVSAGLYDFSDYYQSNISSQITAELQMSDGSFSYIWMKDLPAATAWTKASAQISVPSGVTKMTVFHLIAGVGVLTTDDYSLTSSSAAAGFTRPLVSITLDDGWASQYTNGLPVLNSHNFPATFYITSGFLGTPDYMTNTQVLNLSKTACTAGCQIADHTVTHPHLPLLTTSQVAHELGDSQIYLQNLIGKPVTDFCTPYGEYNDSVLTQIKQYFRSHRSVEPGLNTKSAFDIYNLRVMNITSTTTTAELTTQINQASASKAWLILVYHRIDANPETWDSTPAQFSAQMNTIQSSGMTVKTVDGALTELLPQL